MTTIPPITDPMGKYWEQPSLDKILVDDIHAVMTRSTFMRLMDYSHSQPSGVYKGKMWRREERDLREGSLRPTYWLLCWYGDHPDPKYVSNNYREILLID